MRITKNKNKPSIKKPIIIVLIALLILAIIAGIYYFIYLSPNKSQKGNTTSTTDITKDSDTKSATQPSTLPDNSQNLSTTDVPEDTSATAQISRLEEKDGTVYFAANISGASELGRCVVSFSTPNDKPVTKDFDAVEEGSDYVCSVNVPALEFSYLGKWDVTLRYYNGDKQVIKTSTVTIS